MDLMSYESLVTYRNSTKPKYMDFLRLILEHPVGLAAATDSILYAFDIGNASGQNLDIIGDLVGIDRLLPFVPSVGSREMNDEEYRMMIRLKIARNSWDGRNEPILGIYKEVFQNTNILYKDNQDMTISLTWVGTFDYRQAEILIASGLVLVPAGVGFNVTFIGGDTSMRMYVGVAQHGEVIIDRVMLGQRTWQDALDEFLTWNKVREVTWSEFMYGVEIPTGGVDWGDLKNTNTQWGTVATHKWSWLYE